MSTDLADEHAPPGLLEKILDRRAELSQLEIPADGTEVRVTVSHLTKCRELIEGVLTGVLLEGGTEFRVTECNHEIDACEGDEYCLKIRGGMWGLDVHAIEVVADESRGPERCDSRGPLIHEQI